MQLSRTQLAFYLQSTSTIHHRMTAPLTTYPTSTSGHYTPGTANPGACGQFPNPAGSPPILT